MAVPCAACGKPVHEHAVRCPHCGDATGIAPDTRMTYEERAAQIELERVKAMRPVAVASYLPQPIDPIYDPELAMIGGAAVAVLAVGAAVKSAVEAVVHEHEERPEIPRAIAHERKSAPVIVAPEPSHEPEPAPPPSDTPRFLK